MATATQVLAALAALAGENEATLGSNNTTVNKYYGVKGVAYCGYSLMYACKKAGSDILDGCSNAAYVPTLRTYLDKMGWRVSNSEAQAGDIFVYGNDQHTGFVYCGYSGLNVITLEGNSTVYSTPEKAKASAAGTGDYEGIGYKKRYLGSSYKLYRPQYDGAASTDTSTTPSSSSTSVGLASYIKQFQSWLNATYSASLAVDGIYGSNTKKAAIKGYQRAMNATYSAGLAVDGIFGPKSKAAATSHPLKYGAKGNLVYVLQGMLYCEGIDPNGFDGSFGSGTRKAVISFQSAKNLTQDGEAGVKTFTALFA